MNEFQHTWEAFFRQQRLFLVTSVREKIVDWLEGMNFFSIERGSFDSVILTGETYNKQPVRLRILIHLQKIHVSIVQNEKEIFWAGSMIHAVRYEGKYLNDTETTALKSFFRNTYDNCDSYLASAQGEIV